MEFKFSISSTIKDDVIDVSLISRVLKPEGPSISSPSPGTTTRTSSTISSAPSPGTTTRTSSKADAIKTTQQSDTDDESKFIDLLYEYLKIAEGFVEIPYPDETGISVGIGLLVYSNFYSKYKRENSVAKSLTLLKKDNDYKQACRDQGVISFIQKYRSNYSNDEISEMKRDNKIHKKYFNKIAKKIIRTYLNKTTRYFNNFHVLPISTKILLFDQGYAAGTGYLGWKKPSTAKKTITASVQDIINVIKRQGNTKETLELKNAYKELIFNWTKYKIFWKYFHLGGRRQQTIWHLLHFNDLNGTAPKEIHNKYQITVWKKSNFDKYVEAYIYVIQNRLLSRAYFDYHGLRYDDYTKVREQAASHKKRSYVDLSSIIEILPKA